MSNARVKFMNNMETKDNDYVIYWMQASQRIEYNHALEYAIISANKLNKPLIIYFGITDNFPEANYRSFKFMIDGLKEVKLEAEKRSIKMIIENISPNEGVINLCKNAAMLVTDRGYLKIEKQWRKQVSESINVLMVQVESNVIVPVEIASNKEEYSAMNLRKKISPLVDAYAIDFKISDVKLSSLNIQLDVNEFTLDDILSLKIDKEVLPSDIYIGGISNARKWLYSFVDEKLSHYETDRNDPSLDFQSNLSPYLHFGQISVLEIYLEVKNFEAKAFIEELIVRRELAINFIEYNEEYNTEKCLPNWAIQTLEKHKNDVREYIYSLEQFENAETHDVYWNAAQKELLKTGKMHGYMRMYWGKKVIEWTTSYSEAYRILIYLNNKYSIDGRDANGYAGVAWCFGKHDRPWIERSIFGMIRYMNAGGLKRKFDIDKYVEKIDKLI